MPVSRAHLRPSAAGRQLHARFPSRRRARGSCGAAGPAGLGSSSVLATWSVVAGRRSRLPPMIWAFSGLCRRARPGRLRLVHSRKQPSSPPGRQSITALPSSSPAFTSSRPEIQRGDMAVEITENGRDDDAGRGHVQPLNNYLMQLNDGVYTLRFVNAGPQTADIRLAVQDRSPRLGKGLEQRRQSDFCTLVSLFSTAFGRVQERNGGGNSAGSSGSIAAFFTSASVSQFRGIDGPDSKYLDGDAEHGFDRNTGGSRARASRQLALW